VERTKVKSYEEARTVEPDPSTTTIREEMHVGRRVRRGVAVFLGALVAAAVLLQVWARLNLDSSSVARALVWMDADVDDYKRFPSRRVPAGPAVEELSRPSTPERIGPSHAFLEENQTTAFIVLRGDEVLREDYYSGSSHEAVQTSFSVAKSFMSTLLGIAVDRGLIDSVDDPITDYIPELAERDAGFERITIRHLMTMSSGLHYEEEGTPWSDDTTTYYAPDLRAAALSTVIEEPPGERFHYNNYNLLTAGMILERATDEHIADFMARELWQPMGAEADASWSLDSENGFEKSESGLNARAIDFARFGLLMLREGRRDGERVVPAEWVREATALDASHDPANYYQYWWWIDTKRPGRYYAAGNKGQYVYVAPDKGAVIVRMGRDSGVEFEEWRHILRQTADAI
jgi:CubicO group peptidase (beta-lactamase class C family)